MRSCPRTQRWLFYGHLEQSGKVKRLSEWVPCELTGNQKHHCFNKKCYLLILCNNNKPFLSQIVMCNENWILNDNQWWPAQWLDWEEALKHCPKLNLHHKRSWSLFGALLPIWSIWSTIAFSVLAKPLYLNSMLSKSKRCTKNCSRNLSKEWAKFFPMTTPDHTSHNEYFKSWTNWATEFCLSRHIHLISCQPNHHFFKHLDNILLGKFFHNQQDAENAFQEFVKSWSMDFYNIGINKFISYWQKCVDCNRSYFG